MPPVSVYRWWARRTQAVSGAVIDAFTQSSDQPLVIADPFCGGGTIPLAALLRGHKVYAQDINPWATRGLQAMLTLPSPKRLEEITQDLHTRLKPLLSTSYSTRMADSSEAEIAHTIRVMKSR